MKANIDKESHVSRMPEALAKGYCRPTQRPKNCNAKIDYLGNRIK